MKSLIKASSQNVQPSHHQRAVICQTIDMILKKGLVGKIKPNQKQVLLADQMVIPDFEFVPDVNPDLSFWVFESEIELI